MPLYEYACRACGARVERMRKVSERLDGPACPGCGKATALAMSAPGLVGAGGGATGGGGRAASRAGTLGGGPGHGGCGPGCCGGACGTGLN